MDQDKKILHCTRDFFADTLDLSVKQLHEVVKWVGSIHKATMGDRDVGSLTVVLLKLLVADPFFNTPLITFPGFKSPIVVGRVTLPFDVRKAVLLSLDDRGLCSVKERLWIYAINRVMVTRASDLFGEASFVSSCLFERVVKQEYGRTIQGNIRHDTLVAIACSRTAIKHVTTLKFPPKPDRMVSLSLSEGGKVYLQCRDTFVAEKTIAKVLQRVQRNPDHVDVLPIDARFLDTLDDPQRQVLRMVAARRLSIVSGRAGTGKSHTVHTMYQWVESLGLRTFCVSPYHRTVERLRELGVRRCATATSWRLRYLNERHENDAADAKRSRSADGDQRDVCTEDRCRFELLDNKWCPTCGADVLILDESGICATHDVAALLDWLDNHWDCRLVLVGDTNQMPPIVGGSAITGVIDVCPRMLVTLERVQRIRPESGHLLSLSDNILGGDPDIPDQIRVLMHLDDIWPLFRVGSSMVITHTNSEADAVNADLSLKHFQSSRAKRCDGHPKFFYGQTVCVTQGDCNGVVGTLVATQKIQVHSSEDWNDMTTVDGAEILVCEGRSIQVPIDSLAPGYAATLNRVQGCEFDQVFVLINGAGFGHFGNKRWIYTACTRAKNSLFFVSDILAGTILYRKALGNPCPDLHKSTLIAHHAAGAFVRCGRETDWTPERQPSLFHDWRLALKAQDETEYPVLIDFLRAHVDFS